MVTSEILPDWLAKGLPKIKEPAIIYYSKDTDSYILSDHGIENFYTTLKEAYKEAKSRNIEFDFDINIPDDDCCNNYFKDYGTLFIDGTIYFAETPKYDLIFLEERYQQWLNKVTKYENDPQDFMSSYDFVNNHITLWEQAYADNPFSWKPNSNLIFVHPYEDDSSKGIKWMILFGPNNQVSDQSIEKAYIKLAKKLYDGDFSL